MSSKINAEGMLLFEQPFARVPYENYRKVFRTSQKYIERDLNAVQSMSTDLKARTESGNLAEVQASIDVMIAKVEGLKRKLSELHETSGKPTQDVMRERLQHLGIIENLQTTASPEFGRWADTRLDRWLVDWSLRNGKGKTARKIAHDRDIETLVDIELFDDIRRIESALGQHNCSEALAWCNENKSALRKLKNNLEFDLRLQEYIELCRADKKLEAISYMQKHLASWRETHLSQIQQASALLVCSVTTRSGPYKRLYDTSRWTNLIQSFRTAIYQLNTLPTEPLLNLSLYAGLAALKIPACSDPTTQNVNCPVCDCESHSKVPKQGLGKLAEEAPLSHHANSTIVCRMSGKIMDEDNMPMAFPDGRVYSREALESMAAKGNGKVTSPDTGATCELSELRRVFIS